MKTEARGLRQLIRNRGFTHCASSKFNTSALS